MPAIHTEHYFIPGIDPDKIRAAKDVLTVTKCMFVKVSSYLRCTILAYFENYAILYHILIYGNVAGIVFVIATSMNQEFIHKIRLICTSDSVDLLSGYLLVINHYNKIIFYVFSDQ